MANVTKICIKCNIEKELVEFAKSSTCKDGRRRSCKSCRNEYTRNYYKENKDSWYLSGWRRSLKIKYGITEEEYNLILQKQNGACAICKKENTENSGKKKRLCVDHNHTTGKVRGLLCDNCNIAIGKFNEDIKIIIDACKYLGKN